MAPTQPNTKPFLFVNKSKTSVHLSKSLPQEKAAIQRHVQTDRKRKRHAKLGRPQLPTTCTLNPTNDISQRDGREVDRADWTYPVLEPTKNVGSTEPGGSEGVRETQHTALPSCHTVLCKQDPFDSASIHINKAVAGLLHYYMFYYHPSQWPNEMAVLRQGVYMFKGRVLAVLRRAVADKLTMYSLLSATACRLQFVDRLPCPLVARRESYYIQEALQLMALHIATDDMQEKGQLNQFLTCILFLNSAEAFRGDLSAAKTHLDAAVRVLEPMGGLSTVEDKHLQGSLAMADLFLACVKVQPCLFECFYDPGPAKILKLTDHELQTPCELATASSLLNRPNTFIHPKLRALVEELLESHTVKSRISTSSMSSTRATQVTHWVTLRNMAIRNKLLKLRIVEAKNHVLRIAIIMWSLLTMNVTGRAKTVRLMAPELRNSLCEISPFDWNGNEDVRFWIILVGLYCASEESDTSIWFRGEYDNLCMCWIRPGSTVARAPNVAERLETFQRMFLFDVPVQRVQTCAIADKLPGTVLDGLPQQRVR